MQKKRGFIAKQKQQMVLSIGSQVYQTMLSDNSVKCFLELVSLLLKIKGVTTFLSEKLSQDPTEKFL